MLTRRFCPMRFALIVIFVLFVVENCSFYLGWWFESRLKAAPTDYSILSLDEDERAMAGVSGKRL